MAKPKFSSSAVTDKIEWWLIVMVASAFFVLQCAWQHNIAGEWGWFGVVALSGVRVWLLKNDLAKTTSVTLTGNKETDDAALQQLADFIRGE